MVHQTWRMMPAPSRSQSVALWPLPRGTKSALPPERSQLETRRRRPSRARARSASELPSVIAVTSRICAEALAEQEGADAVRGQLQLGGRRNVEVDDVQPSWVIEVVPGERAVGGDLPEPARRWGLQPLQGEIDRHSLLQVAVHQEYCQAPPVVRGGDRHVHARHADQVLTHHRLEALWDVRPHGRVERLALHLAAQGHRQRLLDVKAVDQAAGRLEQPVAVGLDEAQHVDQLGDHGDLQSRHPLVDAVEGAGEQEARAQVVVGGDTVLPGTPEVPLVEGDAYRRVRPELPLDIGDDVVHVPYQRVGTGHYR